MALIKSKQEINLMKKSGRLAQKLLRELGEAVQPGATGKQLDEIAAKLLKSHAAKSPFLGHHGYPSHITISVNDVVVHGIPTDKPFETGDIVSVDVGTRLNGFIGDNAWTFPVGPIPDNAQKLLEVTEESLWRGIAQAKAGNKVGDISHAVQSFCEGKGYGVVRDLCGHGVGREMWEEPSVPNFGPAGKGPVLRAGMAIAIEPMINEGTGDVKHLADKWTVVTADGKLSAHFEHSIVITSDGPEILTSLD
ncbi:MAG TPA: type I methionyl aminopeptidase [Abditibacteriaceae bacterium]|jgi:methionyl aminopeptidase